MATPMTDGRLKWTVHTKIEKFNTPDSWAAKDPDEVLQVPGNCLTNVGVNLLWALVAGGYRDGSTLVEHIGTPATGTTRSTNYFDTTACIGIGDNNGTADLQPTAADTGLTAGQSNTSSGSGNFIYMKMNEGYPIAGKNQKITFQSTFFPGVACFDWLEWCVANGNGNPADLDVSHLQTVIFDGPEGTLGDQPLPDPQPTCGISFENGVGEANVVLLNHKQENMGRKYSSATWIVTVELSLS